MGSEGKWFDMEEGYFHFPSSPGKWKEKGAAKKREDEREREME